MNKIKFISYNKDSDHIDVIIAREKRKPKHYRYIFASDQVKRIGRAISSMLNNNIIDVNIKGSVISGIYTLYITYVE